MELHLHLTLCFLNVLPPLDLDLDLSTEVPTPEFSQRVPSPRSPELFCGTILLLVSSRLSILQPALCRSGFDSSTEGGGGAGGKARGRV